MITLYHGTNQAFHTNRAVELLELGEVKDVS